MNIYLPCTATTWVNKQSQASTLLIGWTIESDVCHSAANRTWSEISLKKIPN